MRAAQAGNHDGRVLSFIEHNGAFYPQADISDRLTGSAATGWTYVSAETEETETYDADGRQLCALIRYRVVAFVENFRNEAPIVGQSPNIQILRPIDEVVEFLLRDVPVKIGA